MSVHHYVWAGLDFMLDTDGQPVLLEANRASHMLGEYLAIVGDERPFEITAAIMNAADGPPCVLWRRGEPFRDADEDAPFITSHLSRHLRQPPHICRVEDNQAERTELLTEAGQMIRPGSLFRWWYALPWSYERTGVRVINSNAAWCAVRDKWLCYEALSHAKSFRVPRSFPVWSQDDVISRMDEVPEVFQHGFVLKPRVGWGGQDMQIETTRAVPASFQGAYVLSERIVPPARNGRVWDVRAFVMGGEYLGGIIHSSSGLNTNYWQGGQPEPLDAGLSDRIRNAAEEAVRHLDAAAGRIHDKPLPDSTELTRVRY